MRIAIYDPYIDTLGGGENVLSVLAETMEGLFPEASIDILVHALPRTPLEGLMRRFGVSLSRTRYRVEPLPQARWWSRSSRVDLLRRLDVERRFSAVTEGYSLFINNCIFSTLPPRAATSIYLCMFPLPPGSRRRGLPVALAGLYSRVRAAYYHRVAASYDRVWANSQYTRKWIRRLWGVDSEVLYPPVEVGPEPAFEDRRDLILSVGRFFPGDHNKKHGPMIDAFIRLCDSGLKGWELHLAGGLSGRPEAREYARKLQGQASGRPIVFHFNASEAELAGLQDSAKIFWHAAGYEEDEEGSPEKHEHFGMSTVEAMSRGAVPVVIAKGGQPEIIEHGRNGLLWHDRDGLLEATRSLVSSEELRIRLARAARERSKGFDRAAFRAEVAKRLSL